MSYYLCPGSVDMRKGIYSLYQIVKSQMKRNPLSGEVFIFLGKNRRCIKILLLEKDGFLLYHKKLEKGTYELPLNNSIKGGYGVDWCTFILILEGVGLRSVKLRKRFESGLK